ncbi:MAG: class I SAM-dependent methyltransferase [Ignavibacteriales bacterium]|nr:class I SAM-dependent methyltransferase [Ignavibacteriales bacterium]
MEKMPLEKIKELTKAAYNSTAVKYHESFKDEVYQKEFDRLLLDSFSDMLPHGSAICDAGCGPSAQYGRYLFEKGHSVTGIDISEKCIQMAASYNPSMNLSIQDIMQTDFAAGTFSGIIAFHSIIYTPKAQVTKIFAEFNRILTIGGKLLIAVKKGESEGIIDDAWYEGNKVYFSNFTEEEISHLMIENNFYGEYTHTRPPYAFEFPVDRIYAIGTKMSSAIYDNH